MSHPKERLYEHSREEITEDQDDQTGNDCRKQTLILQNTGILYDLIGGNRDEKNALDTVVRTADRERHEDIRILRIVLGSSFAGHKCTHDLLRYRRLARIDIVGILDDAVIRVHDQDPSVINIG